MAAHCTRKLPDFPVVGDAASTPIKAACVRPGLAMTRYQGDGLGDCASDAGRTADKVIWALPQSSPVACWTSAS